MKNQIENIENHILKVDADRQELVAIREQLMTLRVTSPGQLVVSVDDTIEHCKERIETLKEDLKSIRTRQAQYNNGNNGGTGHGDDSYSDADPGL